MNVLSRLLVILRWAALLSLLIGAVSPALAAKTYSDNGDGTVTDPTTGLSWMRCSMGQTWDGTTCTGTAGTYTFDQANALTGTVTFAGQSDWRLPNIRELQTIVDRSKYNPAIDSNVFPNTPSFYFGSSSLRPSGTNNYGWDIHFGTGDVDDWGRFGPVNVRMVRGGDLFGSLLTIIRPTTDYVDHGDGTVTHIPTGLMWLRCSEGQVWTGDTCSGSGSNFTWDAASLLGSSFAGKSDWRLPTEDELLSLVDYSGAVPSVNIQVFPNMPSWHFWSSSPSLESPSDAWYVYSSSGGAGKEPKASSISVRLVRGGLLDNQFAMTVSKTGTGTVNSSLLAGVNCGLTCTNSYTPGTQIILAASPSSSLITWGGACAGAGTSATCIVTMDAAKSVTATFKDTPAVTGLPTNLTFALQNKGSTSATQGITLTNSGTAALAIGGIATTGDFSVTNNCGGGLGVGGYCTLNVSFSPTATGNRTGTLTITSDAPGSPHTVNLSGSGMGAKLQYSPSYTTITPFLFWSHAIGTTSPAQTFTLTNIGGDTLTFSGLVTSAPFSHSTTCGQTLNPGESCAVNEVFAPTVAGSVTGTLVISSNDVGSPAIIGLSGTGVAVPIVSLNPTTLGFSSQNVATTSAAQSITLTNSGGAPLNLTSFTATGDFAITGNCGGGLGAGGFCTINVTFAPSAGGARSGSIVIVSNAAGSPQTINLNGTGVAAVAGPPTSVSATAGAAQAMVSFVAPSGTGGSPITGYTVTSIPTGGIDSNAGSSALLHTITGLTNGTAYTFTVVATNGAGNSTASSASNSVTPLQISQTISFGVAPILVVGGTGMVSATGGGSGNDIILTTKTPTSCAVNAMTVTSLTVDNCIVAANQAGTASYLAAIESTLTILQYPAVSPSISAGEFHSMTIKSDGSLWTWGWNKFGQLGDGTTNDSLVPEQIGTGYKSIAATGWDYQTAHNIALKADGSLWAWGSNGYGQLGDGTTTNSTVPKLIDVGYTSIAVGFNHTVALKSDGSLWAWGANSEGQLGDGTTKSTLVPKLIGVGYTGIAAGAYSTFAFDSNGGLWAWGHNGNGQLGNGTVTNSLVPRLIGSSYISVASAFYHTVAIKSDGSLWAWGANFYGEIGDGTTTTSLTPVNVGTDFAAVSAGNGYTEAIKIDGSVWAWGQNGNAQLGYSPPPYSSPVPTQTGLDYVAVSAGRSHTIALKANGSLWAWGDNWAGDLGDGTYTPRTTATLIFPMNLDMTIPSVPTGLTVTHAGTGFTQANIYWTDSTDNVAVTNYKVFRDGVLVSNSVTTSYSDSGLSPGTTYSYSVSACDKALNCSAQSSIVILSTIASQSILNLSFSSMQLVTGGTATLLATGGGSGNPVTFKSTTPTICTVVSSTVTALATGNCVIAANQSGNINYAAAMQVTQSISVGQGSQVISFGTAPALTALGSATVSATGGASGNAVTFSSTTVSVCSVNGSTVSALSAGNCVIAANQAGNANYAAAPQVTQTIVVAKFPLPLSFGTAPQLSAGASATLLVARTDLSLQPVVVTSLTPSVCSVSGTTVTALTVGVCTVAANQAGDANYAAATQVTQNISVGQGTQSLSFSLGWNLLGNILNQILSVVPTFADTAIVTTVWKWDVTVPGWQFYAPSMTPTELQTYATSKGYGVLSSINPGEGYWVNAKVAGSLGAQAGSAYTLTSAGLVTGWNLVATSTDVTPSTFNISLSATPPSQGTIPINLTTLWAWDSTQSKWYFYAPGLEASGGLGAYITGKGYLDFTTANKTLGNGVGFWVNKP